MFSVHRPLPHALDTSAARPACFARLARLARFLSRGLLGACFALLGFALSAAAQQQAAFQQPSPAVRDLLDAPLGPKYLVSPNKQQLALVELRRFSTLAELARPKLKLAGLRFDAASGAFTLPGRTALVFVQPEG